MFPLVVRVERENERVDSPVHREPSELFVHQGSIGGEIDLDVNQATFGFQSASGVTYNCHMSTNLVAWDAATTSGVPVVVNATSDVSSVTIDLPPLAEKVYVRIAVP